MLGLWFFLLAAVVTHGLARRHPGVAQALWVAFFVRFLAAVTHAYVFPLPGGDSDAVRFEALAWAWGQDGAVAALGHFRGPDSFFYCVKLAVLYGALGRSSLMAQALSVLAGTLSVFCAWLLGRELQGKRAGRKTAWCVALFPAVVLFSVFTLRESYFVLCLTAGLYWAVRWRSDPNRLGRAVAALICWGIGVFYHGAMLMPILVFFLFLLRHCLWHCSGSLRNRRIPLLSAAIAASAVAALAVILLGGVAIPKMGRGASGLLNMDRILRATETRTVDTAAYPEWTVPEDAGDLVWNAPVRLAYFVWSPFPWDIRSRTHWIGFADSLLYWCLLLFLVANRKRLLRNPKARQVFWLVLPLMFVFALGTGNFGTALRHRAKFAVAWIALAAPTISAIRWRRICEASIVCLRDGLKADKAAETYHRSCRL